MKMQLTKQELINRCGKGPNSNWHNSDGTPVTRPGFYADWNHRIEYGATQEEATQKLIKYFTERGFVVDN